MEKAPWTGSTGYRYEALAAYRKACEDVHPKIRRRYVEKSDRRHAAE
jgi:hypothetical protein